MVASPPTSPNRRVRRLRVASASHDDALRVTTSLADALHTASIPFADRGKLVVIRRLDLGRISPHANSISLSLRLESALREIQAVSFDFPGAENAPAVAFPDRFSGLIALARCLANGATTEQWFWEAIVPGWRTAKIEPER